MSDPKPWVEVQSGGERRKREREQSDNLQTLIHIPNLPYSLNKNQWILNSES